MKKFKFSGLFCGNFEKIKFKRHCGRFYGVREKCERLVIASEVRQRESGNPLRDKVAFLGHKFTKYANFLSKKRTACVVDCFEFATQILAMTNFFPNLQKIPKKFTLSPKTRTLFACQISKFQKAKTQKTQKL